MKTLYIVRHAKAIQTSEIDDFDRELTTIGYNDAIKVGKRLAVINIKPDVILTSPAKRAMQTAKIIAEEINKSELDIKSNRNIYEGDMNNIIDLIKLLPDDNEQVMLVGHNPTLKILADFLYEKKVEWLPKCGVIALELNINSWKNVNIKIGTLLFFTHPKEFVVN
jgi:phosphohistidine phosphatase